MDPGGHAEVNGWMARWMDGGVGVVLHASKSQCGYGGGVEAIEHGTAATHRRGQQCKSHPATASIPGKRAGRSGALLPVTSACRATAAWSESRFVSEAVAVAGGQVVGRRIRALEGLAVWPEI